MTLFEICLLVIIVGNCTFGFVLALAGLKLLKKLTDKDFSSCVSTLDYYDWVEVNSLVSKLNEYYDDQLEKINERNNLYDRFGK